MILRYASQDISRIWRQENKFELFLEVELALLKQMELRGNWKIPSGTSDAMRKLTSINTKRISEIENDVGHDIVAFCRHIEEQLPNEIAKYFHFGATSSDIADTALAIQVRNSIKVILRDWDVLDVAFENLINRSHGVLCAGRTHGQIGEPILLAQKWWGHHLEFKRRRKEIEEYLLSDIRGKLSGAMGNYTIIPPVVELLALKELGIERDDASTQIVPRDRLAKLISIGSLYASALERFCSEIRHLSRTEVGEVSEGFKKGQTGSSTMPHKKNPISSENLTGIARVMRSHNSIALENIVTLHERDISHSSTERLYLPDHMELWSYSIKRLTGIIDRLEINGDVMARNLTKNPHIASSVYLHHAISELGFDRSYAYEAIQSASFEFGNTSFEEFQIACADKLGVGIDSLPRIDMKEMIEHYSRVFIELRELSA